MCLQEEEKEIKQVNNVVAISKKELKKPHESQALKTCARQPLFSHVPLPTTVGRLCDTGPRSFKPQPCGKNEMGAFKKQGRDSNLASNGEMESEKEQETERY